jgi:hypothetical protein
MRVHVSQARRQVRSLASINYSRILWHRKSASHRHDFAAFDDDGLIREHSFTVHWDDIDVNKSRGLCRPIVGAHDMRPPDRPEQQPDIEMAHIHSRNAAE